MALVILNILNFMMHDLEMQTLYRIELFSRGSRLCSHTSSFWKMCARYQGQCNGNVKGSDCGIS